jgi:hypothetical protein
MSPDELVRALAALALTQQGAARLFGHSDRAMRAWIAGDRMIPAGIAIVVRLLVAGKVTTADVADARDGTL